MKRGLCRLSKLEETQIKENVAHLNKCLPGLSSYVGWVYPVRCTGRSVHSTSQFFISTAVQTDKSTDWSQKWEVKCIYCRVISFQFDPRLSDRHISLSAGILARAASEPSYLPTYHLPRTHRSPLWGSQILNLQLLQECEGWTRPLHRLSVLYKFWRDW